MKKLFWYSFTLFTFFYQNSISQTVTVNRSNSEILEYSVTVSDWDNSCLPVQCAIQSNDRFWLFSRFSGRRFAIPPGKTAQVTITITGVREISDETERKIYLKDGNELSGYCDIIIPVQNDFFPRIENEYKALGSFRGLEIGLIQVPLIQYNPVTGVLRQIESFTVNVSFISIMKGEQKACHPSSLIGKSVTGNLINKNIIGNMKDLPALKKPAVPEDNPWYNPGQEYVKISVDSLNIYRIYYEDLYALNASPQSVDPKTFQLFNKGGEVPINVYGEADGIFAPGEFIEFTADRNKGAESYYDWYTDNNIYWLTWGSENGMRIQAEDAAPSGGISADHFFDTFHFEQEAFYHPGLTEEGVRATEYLPGEGWYHLKLFPGQTKGFSIRLPGYTPAKDSVYVRFAMQGISAITGVDYDHNLEFFINNSSIGEGKFKQLSDTTFTFSASSSILTGGSEQVDIHVRQLGIQDNTHFDWFEAVYPRMYTADKNRLVFTRPANGAQEIIISEFSENDISAYNISTQKRYTNLSVTTGSTGFNADLNIILPEGDTVITAVPRTPENMEKMTFKLLKSSANSADYVIITHPEFYNEAVQFANYRQQQNGFENGIKVITVFDIYDEFSYGIEYPPAIRDFIKYTLDFWQNPPSYVLLFGDASIGYRNDKLYKNYVPSYGYPSSDNWFANADGSDDYIPDVLIGRIPVKSKTEAQGYLQKLKEYEVFSPEKWRKTALFLNGGTTNNNEQQRLQAQAAKMINQYLEPSPFGGVPVVFSKESNKGVDDIYKDEIIDQINQGKIWVNSMGHGSTYSYDLEFGEPRDLSNSGKYPFMISMSCNTLKYSEYGISSIGEEYIVIPDKGGIGYFGTTGWGELTADDYIINELFKSVFHDTLFTMAEATARGRLILLDKIGYFQNVINFIQQYTYIGDPAMEIALPRKPEFVIAGGDVKILDDSPDAADSTVTAEICINNYGLTNSDSCTATIIDHYNSQLITVFENAVLFGTVLLRDSISVNIPIADKAGEHRLEVIVNPSQGIPEYDYTNNSAFKNFTVFKGSLIPLEPLNNAVLQNNSLQFSVSSGINNQNSESGVFFEIDTSLQFSEPLITSGEIHSGDFKTLFPAALSLDNQWYHWRVRGTDSEDFTDWQYSSFFTDFTGSLSGNWLQSGVQFLTNQSSGCSIQENLTLEPVNYELKAISAGFFDGLTARLFVNGYEPEYEPYNPDNTNYNQGFFCLEFDPRMGTIVRAMKFNTYAYPEHSAGLADFLRSASDGNFILAGIKDTGVRYLSIDARDALAEIGSKESYNIAYRNSYAIIAEKGNSANVTEILNDIGDGQAIVEKNVQSYKQSGYSETDAIRGFRAITAFFWDAEFEPGEKITFTFTGVNSISGSVEQVENIELTQKTGTIAFSPEKFADFRSVSAKISLERGEYFRSPALKMWGFTLEPAPNVTLMSTQSYLEKDSVDQGEPFNGYVMIANTGSVSADSLQLSMVIKTETGENPADGSPFILTNLPADSVRKFPFTIPTNHLLRDNTVIWKVNSGMSFRELSYDDNYAEKPFYVYPDLALPEIEITIDGKSIQENDYIANKPEISVLITDNNPTALLDTSQIALFLNDSRIDIPSNSDVEYGKTVVNGKSAVTILYKPDMKDGNYTFKTGVFDDSDNYAEKSILFKVQSALDLYNVANFPNPCTDGTHFTYMLTQGADRIILKIYTVNGRKIFQSNELPVNAGYNTWFWDMKDNTGDIPANGTYIYTLQAKKGNESAKVLSKVAIVR